LANRSRGIIIAAVGFVFILVSLVVGFLYLRGTVPSLSISPEPTPIPVITANVFVAAKDMFMGEIIDEGDLSQIEVPAEIVPRNAVVDIESVLGKFIKVDLVQGEMLLAHHVADPTNFNHDLGYIISDDHIMMAFPAEDLISTESIIKRGDIVDLFVTLPQTVTEISPDGEETEITQLFTFNAMQRVEVTAMVMDIIPPPETEEGEEPAPMRRDYIIRAYLLAMDPQSALLVKHLKDAGAIFDLVLRAPSSEIQHNLTPITQQYLIELFGLEILP
jgi:Flp pilus assembly protein CpaB